MRDLHLTAGVVDLTLGRVDRHDRRDAQSTLTTTERALLAYLAANPGRDVPRTELLTQVWGYAPSASSRTLDTAVKVLRRKVEADPRRPDHILTVWGVGYRFEPLDVDADADADLVGRAGELAAIEAALRGGARLLTLVGPGGVGKTRLARAIAERRADALFVDLSTAGTDEHLVQAVALAAPDPRRPLSERVRDLPRVLILDNVEQMLPSVRRVALPWLDAAPELALVLTSRAACGDAREQAVDVRPLPIAAATALLRRRTAQARRAEVVEDEAVLQQVAAAMDGLPLALELAASRAAVLGMDEILARGPRMVSDDTDGPGRHGSILAAVRWSLGLVDDEARGVLAAAAVFRAPFVAADVQVVVGELDVVAPLERLFRASLVARHPDGLRLYVLPLVRIAVEALAPADPAMVERYVGHVLDRAARGREDARAVAEDLRGLVGRPDLRPAWVARAGILLVGVLGRASGEHRDADVDRIRAAADRSGDVALQAEAQLLRCSAALWTGRARRDAFDEAVALARASADPGRIGWALGHLGTLFRLDGDAQAAIRTLTEGIAIAGPDAPPDRLTTLLTELGLAKRAAFDWPGALDAFDAALTHAARAGDPFAEQALMHRLGGTLLQLARFDAARVWLVRARDTAERAGFGLPAFEIRGSLAYLELERGDLDAAEAGFGWCLGQASLARGFHRVVMHAQLALLCVERGDFARAADLAAIARSWADKGAAAAPASLAHLAEGVWRAFVGDPGAVSALTTAIAADPAGDQALFALGYRSVVTGDPADAAEVARRAASEAASPATLAFAAACAGEPPGSAWVHARLVGALRRARATARR